MRTDCTTSGYNLINGICGEYISLQKIAQKIAIFFSAVKIKNSIGKILIFLIFCSKRRLWVHIRTASLRQFQLVLTIYVVLQK